MFYQLCHTHDSTLNNFRKTNKQKNRITRKITICFANNYTLTIIMKNYVNQNYNAFL